MGTSESSLSTSGMASSRWCDSTVGLRLRNSASELVPTGVVAHEKSQMSLACVNMPSRLPLRLRALSRRGVGSGVISGACVVSQRCAIALDAVGRS